MPLERLNGVDLYYETDGDGVAVLLVAGLASDGASWAPIRPALAARYRLILPDNRGAGRTRPDDAPFQFNDVTDDLAALLDHLRVDRAHVVGHSMGGLLSATFAARHPDRVDRLVVAAAAPRISPRAGVLFEDLAKVRALDEELYYRLFFQWLFAPGFFADRAAVDEAVRLSRTYPFAQSPKANAAQLAAAATFDPALLGRVRAPTLALCGALDLLFTEADIRAGLTPIPNLEVQTLENAAHSLHWDQPAAFVDAVTAFLRAG